MGNGKRITNSPFFSVITCTLNSVSYVERNILSVRSQFFNDYEHIFVDGLSSDGTLDIIKAYASNDRRARVISSPPRGVANAFNVGVENSRGKYLIFLNSDDYFFSPESLKEAFLFIKGGGRKCDWFYSKVKIVDDRGKELGFVPQINFFSKPRLELLRLINYIPHQGVFIKRKVFERFGFFSESVRFLADYEYWLRISDKTRWCYFNNLTSVFTARRDSVSLDPSHWRELKEDTLSFHRKYSSYVESMLYCFINFGFPARFYRYVRYYK